MKVHIWLRLLWVFLYIGLCCAVCEGNNHMDNIQAERCAKTETVLGESLTSEVNLFKLREFLDKNQPPNLLDIHYTVRITDSQNNYVPHEHNVTWTDSSVLAVIHPEILSALQPGILNIGLYFGGMVSRQSISLIVKVLAEKLPPLEPSRRDEIQHGLETLTLKITAELGANERYITVWKNAKPNISNILKMVVIAAVLLATFVLIITVMLGFRLFKTVPLQASDTSTKTRLFRSFIHMVKFITILECTSVIVLLIIELLSSDPNITVCLIKESILAVAAIAVIIRITVALCLYCKKQNSISMEKKAQHSCVSESCLNGQSQYFRECHYLLLISYIGLYIIPTTILFFVYPVLTALPVVAFVCTFFFSLVTVLALPSPCTVIAKRFSQKRRAGNQKTYLCNTWLPFFPLTIITFILFMCFNWIIKRTDFAQVNIQLQCILLILPSIMNIVLAIIAFRKVTGNSQHKEIAGSQGSPLSKAQNIV